tara:strand:- start:70 stop:666 length:597 start_codon:yes stop_codon:yes gene_type:complete
VTSITNKDKNDLYKLVSLDTEIINNLLSKYPSGRKASAVIPLLHYVQKKCKGWLPVPEIERVAEILDMSYMRVYEIASFYTMFNLKPVGKYFLQVCKTTPCWLRGSDDVERCIKDVLKISDGETTKDGMFSLLEVECLGACVNAPILQINDDYYEDLNYSTTKELLEKFKKNKPPKSGSVINRRSSEPIETNGKKNVK